MELFKELCLYIYIYSHTKAHHSWVFLPSTVSDLYRLVQEFSSILLVSPGHTAMYPYVYPLSAAGGGLPGRGRRLLRCLASLMVTGCLASRSSVRMGVSD